MGVTTLHPEYSDFAKLWKRTRDAVKGQKAIKDGKADYLPADFAKTDPERYLTYLTRAYWLGATRQAYKSMQGMIYRKPANMGEEFPAEIEQYQENIDGSGQSLEQFAKYMTGELEQTGRFGLLVDFQRADDVETRAQERELGLRPYFAAYPAESITNWKTEVINGQTVLSLVVLKEKRSIAEDEFGHDTEDQYRVLRLRNGVYTQQVLDQDEKPLSEEFIPRMGNGMAFSHIPFYIAGSENNRPDIDYPLLLDLANLNIAHYQITADHMENLFIHGQLTLGISSKMNNAEFKEANPDGVRVGARTGHFLGEGGQFHSVTAPESSSLRVALQDLEAQMEAVGAKFVQRGGQAETAEAARLNASAEASALDTLVNNASDVLEKAFVDFLLFLGIEQDVTYRLNTDFYEQGLSSQLGQVVTGLYQNRIVALEDVIHMIKAGKIELPEGRTLEDIQEALANEMLNDTSVMDS